MNQTNELMIEDIIIGEGKKIQKGALVLVHYEGFLNNGFKFEASKDKGKPFQFVFGTGRVIKGWDQGLIGMNCGGKRRLFVPAFLAYGERQIGQYIKPNTDLHFVIELLEVLTRDD